MWLASIRVPCSVDINRDTQLRDAWADTPGGWALIPDPSGKEHRFCKRLDMEIIEADIDDLLAVSRDHDALAECVNTVGC